LEPINSSVAEPTADFKFGTFVRQVYLPFYRRKWKVSTTGSNEDRVGRHLVRVFDGRPLQSFNRDELQVFLDKKALLGFSYSVVAHLRWDMRQIFRMAVAEGYLSRNPADLLFVPREAHRLPTARMTLEQVTLFFSVLDLREQLIAGLAILAGLRPGEIFALRLCHLEQDHANIRQRIYRGLTDTPKTVNSTRLAALGDGLTTLLQQWIEMLPQNGEEAWVFPSEKGTTPVIKDNVWRRFFLPRLKPVGLEWANFQVMRRTHSSLLDELGVDPASAR
jgi:integrase